jgi:MATE family multidrug resistance protein
LDFPKLGILGAALGTVLSRIMMVVFMHYWWKKRRLKKILQNFSFKGNKSILKKIINFRNALNANAFEVTLI